MNTENLLLPDNEQAACHEGMRTWSRNRVVKPTRLKKQSQSPGQRPGVLSPFGYAQSLP